MTEKTPLRSGANDPNLINGVPTAVGLSEGGAIATKLSSANAPPQRDKWSSYVEFIMSCVGYAIGLGNVWRFPYLCYSNGGGAFLIPYIITVILCGIPLFILETSWGQLLSVGGLGMYKICPLFKGVGIAAAVMAFWLNIYYVVVLAWALFYLWNSIGAELPWGNCNNEWNTGSCRGDYDKWPCKTVDDVIRLQFSIDRYDPIDDWHRSNYSQTWVPANWTMCTQEVLDWYKYNRTSPVAEFWERRTLNMTSSITDVGGIRYELALTLLIAWILCYFCIFKGVKLTGKVVYLTAVFPYCMLFCLLIRGLTLPGAGLGLAFYLKPNFSLLLDATVWIKASTQVFFSYGLGLGALVALGSYNVYHNNVYKQALTVCCINSATSLFAGFVIFSFLGYMAREQGKTVQDVAREGPGLLFLAYPSGILKLFWSPAWSIMFFSMVVFLGLDSQFCTMEGFFTAIIDEWPTLIRGRKYGRELFILFVCVISYFAGLSTVTKGGMYVFQLFDTYAASGWALLWLLFFECIAISWGVGIDRWYEHMKDMIGYYPGRWWRFCWVFATPAVCASVMIFSLWRYKPIHYDDKDKTPYPWEWQAFGWFLALSSMVCIPAYAVYKWFTTSGTFHERVKALLRPEVDIGEVREGGKDDKFEGYHLGANKNDDATADPRMSNMTSL